MKTRNFILSIFMMMFCSMAFGQNWGDFNYHNYPNNMTVNAVISIDGELQSNPNLTIAPYCGDERRGEPAPAVKAVTGKYMACMLIYGNENGDNITFKLYDGECMYDNLADYNVAFEANAVYGDLRYPKTINFKSAAKVGDKKYGKLQAAVNAAEGKTVEVINDVTLREAVVVAKSTTIDFANKAITANVFPAFRIQGNANVTVKNGDITNNDYVFVLGSSDGLSEGNLTIESGKYVGETTVASVTKGQLNITGGEFDLQNVGQYGYTYLINCIDANYPASAKVAIKGGKFYGFNPENNAAEGANTNFCAEGYVASEYTENGVKYYIVEEGGWVAQNTTTGVRYKTLQAAIDACAAGNNNIVLLADNSENVTVKQVEGINVTIDGAGLQYSGTFTIHGNARYEGAETLTFQNINFVTDKASHYFIDSNSTAGAERYAHNVTVKDCNFTATEAGKNTAVAMRIRQGFDITINGGTFTDLHSALQAYGNNGIAITGITVNGKNGISAGTSTDVVIDNSTITATGYGVRADGEGAYDVTINGTTTITAEMPVVVRKTTGAYDLSIGTGVTLVTTGEYQVIMTTGDDGTYVHPTANATATINSAVTSIFGFEARIGNVYYTTLSNALNAEGNENVTLLRPYTVAASETVVLDLKGKTVVYSSDVMGEAMITNNGTLTVKNGTIAYKYTGAADSAYTKGNYTINNYGTLTVEGNVENNTAKMSHASYAINNMSNATTTINSGKVVNAGNYAIRQFASGSNINTLTINGGEVEGTRAVWMQAAGSNTADAPAIVLNVNGGTLTGTGESGYKLAVYSYSNGNDMKNVAINVANGTINGDIALTGGKNKTNVETVNISGGRFNGEAGEIYSYGDEAKAIAAITISGGTFNTNDAEKYTEDNGYIFEKNADGTYTVREGVFVAQNITTGKKYESLQAAIDACAAGNNTIVLLADNSENVTVKQVEGINVTIDGAGKKYSSTFTIHGNARYEGAETLTFQNINFTTSASNHIFIDANSTAAAERYAHNVTVEDCSFTATGIVNNYYKTAVALRLRQSYNIAVNDCTFDNLQSVYQAYGNNGITIDNITVEDCWNGISVGTSTNVVIKNSNINASLGYGVRADGTGAYDLTIENSSIKAPRPVVVRETTGAYNLTIGEGVNLTSSAYSNKYQVIMTNGDDDTRVYPTSQEATATIKSNVTNIFGFEAKNNNVYYTALSNAYAKAQDNETITLLRNVELAEIFTIAKAITLDGGNKTLTSAAGRAINVDFAGTVNIQNLTIAGSTGCERGINIINKAGTTNLSNVKVSNVSYYAVHVATSAGAAKVNIENSNLSAWGALAIYGEGSEVNVENTTLVGTNTYTGESDDFATVAFGNNATINVVGGTIKAVSTEGKALQSIVCAQEEVVDGNVTLNSTFVLEGTANYINMNVNDNTLYVNDQYAEAINAEGYATISAGNGLVQVIKAVAKVGATYYATLSAAVEAADANNNVVLIANATGAGVVIDKDVTIDFAGFTYTANAGVGSTGTQTLGFQILKNNNVTLKNGTFTSEGENIKMLVQNYANLTLDNMNLVDATDHIQYALSNNSGNVNIIGNTNITTDAVAFDVYDYTKYNYTLPVVNVNTTGVIRGAIEVSAGLENNLTITGGSFTYDVTDYCADGYICSYANGLYNVTASAVAKIGDTTYPTLAAAVAAAQDGATITILRNTIGAGVVIDKSVTIDFAKNLYSFKSGVGSNGTETNGFQILAGNEVTLKNGALEVAPKFRNNFYILVQNYADLNVVDMKLDGTNLDKYSSTDGDSYALSNNSGTVNITGNTAINANDEGALAFAFDACTYGNYEAPIVNVSTEGIIRGKIESTATILITNGYFDIDVTEWCAPKYTCVYDETTKLYHVVMLPVAKIGDVKYATLADAIAAATAGQTIEFIANINENVTINKSVTIDGANFNYTGTMTANNNITVTVQYVNFVNAGFDKPTKSTNGNYNFYKCTFDGKGTYAYSIKAKGANKININDCTVKNYLYGFLYVSNAVNYGVNVKDVLVENCSSYAVFFNSGAGASTVLENLTVKNSNAGVVYNNTTSSRTFTMRNCTMENVDVAVAGTGGTYAVTCKLEGNQNNFGGATLNAPVKVVLVNVNSTLASQNDDLNVVSGDAEYIVAYVGGIYKLVPGSVLNETQNKRYATIQDAIDASNAGDVIKLLANVNYGKDDMFAAEVYGYTVMVNATGKNIVLDLNGYTISTDLEDCTELLYAVVFVGDNGSLTLRDSSVAGTGTIIAKAGLDAGGKGNIYSLIMADTKATQNVKMYIESGNYELDESRNSGALVYVNISNILTVTGGNFYLGNAGTLANNSPWIFNTYSNGVNHVIVKGGNYNVSPIHYHGEVVIPAEYTVVNTGIGRYPYSVVPAQRQTLETGWNWFSSYIADFNGTKGLNMLKSCIGSNGEQIKNQYNSIKWDNDPDYNNGEYFWFGSLEEVSVTEMLMIKTTAPVELVLGGDIVNPAVTPIALQENWTWIGYPVAAAMNVETAFAGINPQDGDIIKTHNGVAQYYANIETGNGTWSGWYGQSLQSMTPGMGYMYFNKSGEVKTLVYPTPNANTRAEVRANVTAENNHWAPKASAFANNMNIIAVLENNDMMGEFEVAAFVNGEVRGSARPTYVEPIDAYVLFMTIYGEEGEEVSFKYYDIYSDEEHSISNTVNYSDNAVVGSIKAPYMFFASTLGMDENAASTLSIYPNPTTANTAISFETTFDMVEVFNSLGAKVAEYRNVDRIEGIEAAGVYVIRVTNDSAVQNCRLIVK